MCPPDLGVYLLSFFYLYGVSFDYSAHGLSTAAPGYFSKRERGMYNPHCPHLLCVENPLDRASDLGFKVFRIREIADAFAQAYHMLRERMGNSAAAINAQHRVDQVMRARNGHAHTALSQHPQF